MSSCISFSKSILSGSPRLLCGHSKFSCILCPRFSMLCWVLFPTCSRLSRISSFRPIFPGSPRLFCELSRFPSILISRFSYYNHGFCSLGFSNSLEFCPLCLLCPGFCSRRSQGYPGYVSRSS